MNVALVGPEIEENLALRYLAASLQRAGHRATIIPFDRAADADRVARDVLRAGPALVGFSLVAQRRYPDFAHLARLLRARGYRGHITAGGHFAGLRANEVLSDTPEFDTIIHHDGEERILALVEWLESGGTQSGGTQPGGTQSGGTQPGGTQPPESLDGLTWRGPNGTLHHRAPGRALDVDRLAPPARRRPDRTLGYSRVPVVSSRGCSGSCSFCSIHAWHKQVPGGRLRFRSPALVAEEMIALHREHGARVFIFHDDDFLHPDPAEASHRCRAILDEAERGIGKPIAFVLKCRPDDVQEDLFSYLKVKGLVRAYVGIETHSRAGIRALNRRITPEENQRALATLRGLGVYACFNLLLFHPDTTLDELAENLAFLEAHAMHPFDIARAELYARSALEDRMVREGRATGDYRAFDYRIADPRAEAVFRLFSEALWDRHFGGSSILHRSQDLGYRASLLRRLHPELMPASLQARVDALIREVNLDTVSFVRRLSDEVAQADVAWSVARHRALAAEVRSEAAARLRQQDRRWYRLSLELEGRAWIGRMLWDASGSGTPVRAQRGTAVDQPGRLAISQRLGRAVAALPLAVASLGFLSCDGTVSHVCDPPPPPPVRFVPDLEPYLVATCALPDCHAGEAPAGNLSLEEGVGYTELVNSASSQVPRLLRVKPGEPDSSYLEYKIEGTQSSVGGSGDRMPKGGAIDPSMRQKIWQWIYGGARQ
jgi:radical SAM superfamily enzyme YgiQ (UPF0313 family)